MKPVEAMVLLMCAIVGVALLGRRLNVPYPIALVLGGLGISLIPGLPHIHIEPEYIFLVFLPPLIYAAAWMTSWRDFRQNARPIFLLAVGLVLFTTLSVGWVLHWLAPDLPLALAFAFGAIVSPPDAVAATAIAQQLHLPKRIVTVIEGESLVNDATGLVALQFALQAAATGHFSVTSAGLEFLRVAILGLAVGLIAGYLVVQVMRRIDDDMLLIALSLIAPYAAYLPAERLHCSGVLAAVAAGMYGGWMGPEILTASVRLNAQAFWQMLVFLLNCVLFILIGLQLPDVAHALHSYSAVTLMIDGALVSAAVILVRPLWVFPAAWLPRVLIPKVGRRDPMPPWRPLAFVGWSGMRGVVSLAAALALPDAVEESSRDLIIYLTFCVILATLVFQGLSLKWLAERLGLKQKPDDEEERELRVKLARAALARLEDLAADGRQNSAVIERVRGIYERRLQRWSRKAEEAAGAGPRQDTYNETRSILLESSAAERRELLHLRREQLVDEELSRRLEREIDLEESRLRA